MSLQERNEDEPDGQMFTAGKPVWAVGLSFNGRTRQFKGGVAESVKLKV